MLLLICRVGASQDIPDPEFAGRPYFLKDNGLVSFERTDGSQEAKTSMKGMDTYYAAMGDKSDTRFPSGTPPKIIIKVDNGVDPAEMFSIVRGEQGKAKRSFLLRKYDRKMRALDVGNVLIKASYKKIRDSVYEIVFDTTLTAGEYALIPSTESNLKIKMSCFGVD